MVTWAFSPIKYQADMGILSAFMFLWNMLGAMILLHYVLPLPFASSQSRCRKDAGGVGHVEGHRGFLVRLALWQHD